MNTTLQIDLCFSTLLALKEDQTVNGPSSGTNHPPHPEEWQKLVFLGEVLKKPMWIRFHLVFCFSAPSWLIDPLGEQFMSISCQVLLSNISWHNY